YGIKAEEVRKERNKLQEQRGEVSRKLKKSMRLEGLLQELDTKMGQMDTRLSDVLTASSHLHSAWLMIGTAINKSIESLKRIETDQEIFKFAIFFKRFIGQWKDIEQFALHMHQVFDDTVAAK
ncbi:MAG: hypothetical protein RR068_14855, partial [Hafnia sp.]